ncbi:nodulation protein NopA [Sinorhizobium alkalisoli]|uniref:Nodulation protein NopA n=1 Tax=Sinorhizobium alkalisoli TaxID=1752398 RepID=A0A1E3VHW7_9HYPH|nr:nodulation protein NopA [Sinorhizobium alkalisoli]
MSSKVGSNSSKVSSSATGSTNTKAKNDGADAFKAQMEELAAVSTEATNRSMLLRTVTTQLSTVKKVADERVQ